MELWQRKHIVYNLTGLVESTDCNISFLGILQSQKILSAEDVQRIQNGGTNVAKSHLLFEILPTRKQSYKALTSALETTCQSGALEILVAGIITYGSVIFQGQTSLISELLPNLDKRLKQELINLHLQQKEPCMDDLVIKNTIPCKLDYYIQRTILSRRKLDKSLFKEKCSDIFLFQGLEWNELSNLAGESRTDVSSNLLGSLQQLRKKFLLLESLDHFDTIVKNTKDPVHIIQHIKGTYQWIKSHGAVTTIQKFVDKTPDSMTEDSFIKQILADNIPACLTDSPGMGKTVLLANLARFIVDRYPLRLVVFIYLREFIPVLQARLINEKQLDKELIQTVLSEYVSDHPVGRRIVSHKIANEQTHLCFDGFDEVVLEQQEVSKVMLKIIANSFERCQIFVTARLHMRRDLEQTIGTLGFHIAQFNMGNQIEFLVKFWECSGANSEFLTEYAEKCLTTLASGMNESDQDIAGIPLQCYMIGEVFFARAKCYKPGSVLGDDVPIRSLAQLYNELINTKLDSLKLEGIKESLIQAHIHLAIDLIFPEEVSNFVEYPSMISYEQICRVGIIEHAVDTGLERGKRFLHRTFAEYFVGIFASTLFKNLNNKSLRFILDKILATIDTQTHLIDNPLGRQHFKIAPTCGFRRSVITYFLNFHLQQQKISLPFNHIKYNPIEQFRSVTAAVNQGSVELLNFLISLFDKYQSQTYFISKLPLLFLQLVATKHSDSCMLESIFELSKNRNSSKLHLVTPFGRQFGLTFSPLYVASYVGNYKIVEYLIQSEHVCLKDAPFVLHFCMWYSSFQSKAVIERKRQIIKYLARRSSAVLHEKLKGLTPALGKYIHLELLTCALESGASIDDRDENLKSVLHLTPEYMSPEGYHNLILFLLKSFNNESFTDRDVFDCTPLHYAVLYLPILSETLEIFLDHGADINAKDENENSVLFYALRHQSENTLELLKRNGAKLNDKNVALETALHIASKYLNISSATWVIEHGADDHAQDANGKVPSKTNLSRSELRSARVQKYMLLSNISKSNKHTDKDKKLGFADTLEIIVNRSQLKTLPSVDKFKEGNTSLHLEFCQPCVDIKKIKIQHRLNADFNAKNVDGDTPLHLGVINATISKEVLDFAVKVGRADLNLVNSNGLSVLGQAIFGRRHISFLNLLVEYGADVCRLNNFKQAILMGSLKHIKFLLEHGADVLKVSQEGQEGDNPIAYAFYLQKEVHFDIAKFLIASTPQLNFEDRRHTSEIIYLAAKAYEASVKFKTAELFNLMASHGLNFEHRAANKRVILFEVIAILSPFDCKYFATHLNAIGLKHLFHIQDKNRHNLLFYCVSKFTMSPNFAENVLGLPVKTKNNYTDNILDTLSLFEADYIMLHEDGDNLMLTSIRNDSREAVGLMFNNGISLHSINESGVTIFMRACCFYVTNIIPLDMFELVVSLANLAILDSEQVVGVYLYIMVTYESKYDDKFRELFAIFKLHGLSPVNFVKSIPVFFFVVKALDLRKVKTFFKLLINTGFNNLGELKNSKQMNVVQYFIENTEADFQVHLLSLFGDSNKILNSSDKDGVSVLGYAIRFGRSLNMNDLIENRAEVCASSLFKQAILTGSLKVVQSLLQHGADFIKVSAKSQLENDNPIVYALTLHRDVHFDIAKCLITSMPHLNFVGTTTYIPKIVYAAVDAYKTSARFRTAELFNLMASHGLNFAHVGAYTPYTTMFFYVISHLDLEHVEIFIKHLRHLGYNNLGELKNKDSMNVVQYLIVNTMTDFPVHLLSLLGDVSKILNSRDMSGVSVLGYAIRFGRSLIYMKDLIENGAEVFVPNNFKHAILTGNLNVIKFLVQHGADVSKVSAENQSENDNPIVYALTLHRNVHFDIAKCLITSTSYLKFGNTTCITRIVHAAVEAYKASSKFQTAELFNLMASHGLNFTLPDANTNNDPLFFYVTRHLDLQHVETFIKHLVHAGFNNLGELKNSMSMNLVQYYMENTKSAFPIKLISLLGDANKILNSVMNNRNVLMYAIKFGWSVEYIKDLIKNGADVNYLHRYRASLLHHAVQFGDLNCVEFFVNRVRDKNCVTDAGYSALHWAFNKKIPSYDNAKLLVSKGVSVNLESLTGKKIIEFALAAYKRWRKLKSADIFILMLSHGLDIESKGRSGVPILFEIINVLNSKHCEEVLKYLYYNNNKHWFHYQGKFGETLLHQCVLKPKLSIGLFLFFKLAGSDFNIRNLDGDTPLHLRVMNSQLSKEVLGYTVNVCGADLNIVNHFGFSVLAQAIDAERDVKFLKLLLEYGADICNPGNFQAAIRTSRLKYIEFLRKHGANVIKISCKCEGHFGRNSEVNPLLVNKETFFELAKYLIKSTPQINYNKPKCITDLFYWARKKYSTKFRTEELFNILAYYGLNFAHCNDTKDPVLFSIILNLDLDHADAFLRHLVQAGYTNSGELKNCLSMNLVHYFIANTHEFPIRLLPLLGDVKKILNSSNTDGWSVLVYAILFGMSVKYIKHLIENGADVNHLDKNRASLLHFAACEGDLTCIEFFLDHVSDKNCVDNDGKSALYYMFCKYTDAKFDVIKLLISKGVKVKLDSVNATEFLGQALNACIRSDICKSAEILTLMLCHGFDIESKNRLGFTSLLKIITTLSPEHCEEVLKYLYHNNKTHCFHLREHTGDTLSHWYMRKFEPSVELLNIFKLGGVDFNSQNESGETPLHIGVGYNTISKEALDFVVKVGGADLNIVNNYGVSILATAIHGRRKISFLKLLVEYGADVCRLGNFEAAIRSNNLEIVVFLLEHGADVIKVSREGSQGNNPIATAFLLANDDHFEIAKFLITSTPQLNFDDPKCVTEIIYWAVEAYKKSEKFKTVELLNLLASHGLNFAQRDANKKPVLFSVISVMTPSDCKCFVTHISALGLKNLFRIQDGDLWNLLFYCARKFELDMEFLSLFSANEVDFNTKDRWGQSVLFAAVHKDCLNYTLENLIMFATKSNYTTENLVALANFGVDPNVLDNMGNNLLFPSITEQSRQAIEFSLNSGISFHLKNILGVTPFMHACSLYVEYKVSLNIFKFIIELAGLDKLSCDQVRQIYLFLMKHYDTKHFTSLTKVFKFLNAKRLRPKFFFNEVPVFFYTNTFFRRFITVF